MRSKRRTALLAVAAVAALALVVGTVSVAVAGSSEKLAPVTAEELLARMARTDLEAQSVSGELSWQNGLFGNLELPTDLAQMPAQSPLLSSGSGRLWVSEAGLRVESQGSGGDQIAALSKESRLAWTYDSASNTAHRYELSKDVKESPLPSPSLTATLAPAAVGASMERLAPYATVEVTGQTTVAGRAAYVLRMTPVAKDTALGSVQVSVDGETMLPLRFEVFAKGGSEPVLLSGFDSISYENVDASLFEFAAPDGAEVVTESIDAARAASGDDSGDHATTSVADKAAREKLARSALLSVDQAQRLVDYDLAQARDYDARPFRWAHVFGDEGPLTAAGAPVFAIAGVREAAAAAGPGSALVYGSGFGAITLMQTKTTTELTKQLQQLPALAQAPTVDGLPTVRSLFTPLGGVVIWQQDGTTLVAVGMVTQADLEGFVRAVR